MRDGACPAAAGRADRVVPRSHRSVLPLTAAGATLMLTLSSGAAWAHVEDLHSVGPAWERWELTPDIVIATALAAIVYLAGVRRRAALQHAVQSWRHLAFASGLGAIFLALASPIDTMAEHLFFMHQIQHLLLRMIGPMLIVLAAPQALLISGLPPPLRRNVLAPALASRAVRRTFSFLANPAVATVLFIAALYVWQYPPYHDAALLDDTIHYLMHVSMLAIGLLFWWRVFDARPAPTGTTYGARLMMLWVVLLSNIGLGAYTTLKSGLLYPAYDVTGRLFGVVPLTDEMIGGFTIWVPSSMMCLVAVIIVIHLWGQHETHAHAVRAELAATDPSMVAIPRTGVELATNARQKNRALAIGFAAFAVAVFATAIFAGVLDHLTGTAPHGVLAHAPTPTATLR